MQRKYILLLLLLLPIALMLPASHALALEIDYPSFNFGGSPFSILPSVSLTQYIQYFFVFLVIISGILGVMSITWAGFQILLAPSNPSTVGAARERIVG